MRFEILLHEQFPRAPPLGTPVKVRVLRVGIQRAPSVTEVPEAASPAIPSAQRGISPGEDGPLRIGQNRLQGPVPDVSIREEPPVAGTPALGGLPPGVHVDVVPGATARV